MRYIDHIRQMNDGQLAYFLNMLQPNVEMWMLAMERATSDNNAVSSGKGYTGPDKLYGLNGDARELLWIMYKDFDLELQRVKDGYNPGHHPPWVEEKHPYEGRGRH